MIFITYGTMLSPKRIFTVAKEFTNADRIGNVFSDYFHSVYINSDLNQANDRTIIYNVSFY